jgi:hypothetical protein
MQDDDIFSADEEKQDSAITFWFRKSIKGKYDTLANHPNKRRIIARIKRAAEREIEELFQRSQERDAG